MTYSIGLIIFIILILVVLGLMIVFVFYMNNWFCFENVPKLLCFKKNYEELSSLQVTEVDEDENQSLSDVDGRSHFDYEDTKTIAAEDFEKTGEESKRDDEERSDISDERIQKFGIVFVTFKFEMMRSLLTIIFHGVDHLPAKSAGGSTAYQIVVAIFGSSNKKIFKWNSNQFTQASFKSNEVMEFPEMSAKDISSTAVRIRLYGCERKRRSALLGETTIGLGNVNLKKQDQYKLRFEKKAELKHLDKRNMERKICSKPEKVLKTVKVTPVKSVSNSKSNSPSVLTPSESTPSNTYINRSSPIIKSPLSRAMDEENNFAKEMSKKAKISVEEQVGDQSELLLGLGYNNITGRLTVEIVKGSNFKNPLSRTEEKLPNSYVKVTVCAGNNQEITRSKSELRRNQANPLFKEKFMFQIHEFQLPEVTLVIGVYHKKSAHRKELIGWFSIGLHNTSDEEQSHWKNMMGANGEEVLQWHLLQQNTISAQGLPGIN